MTLSRADAKQQMDAAGLRTKRALGQNFVVDPNTVRKIARLAHISATDHVVEVGAGIGSLTLALAETGAHVTAIEIDDDLVPLLRANVGHLDNVHVVHADAMSINWNELLADSQSWHMVANLPYNVGTPLVADILDTVPQITSMLVMVQREVAERLCASPSTEAYGALSVKVAWWADARIVGYVPATVFLPRPNVESALIMIERHQSPAPDLEPSRLFSLVRTGFAKRRKMLRGALAGEVTAEMFIAADVDPESRAEQLDLAAWIRLTRAVTAARSH